MWSAVEISRALLRKPTAIRVLIMVGGNANIVAPTSRATTIQRGSDESPGLRRDIDVTLFVVGVYYVCSLCNDMGEHNPIRRFASGGWVMVTYRLEIGVNVCFAPVAISGAVVLGQAVSSQSTVVVPEQRVQIQTFICSDAHAVCPATNAKTQSFGRNMLIVDWYCWWTGEVEVMRFCDDLAVTTGTSCMLYRAGLSASRML